MSIDSVKRVLNLRHFSKRASQYPTMSWCTIESDPGVFSELLASIGVKDVYCEEIWSLEDRDAIDRLRPIFGLVFLFKYKSEGKQEDRSTPAPHVYFAKQMITNACGTQALINLLLNLNDKIDVGPELKHFLEFTESMDPETRGLTIANFDSIRLAHNSFARHQNFTFEEKIATEDDDVYHFIGYVPKDGMVYELDGLQQGPIEIGPYTDDWIAVANGAIQQRFSSFGGIRFNLLALCKNPLRELLELQQELKKEKGDIPDHLLCKIEELQERTKK